MKKKEQCPEFPYFGATYPDAQCIGGYLHDMDDCDDNGRIYLNEDAPPCPFCNGEEFMEYNNLTTEELQKFKEFILNKSYKTFTP